jgi:uncharacterized membrane protein
MRTGILAIACVAAAAVAAPGCDLQSGGQLADQPSSGVADSGFPCDVRAVLQSNCAPCHAGNTYVVPLNTRDIWLGLRGDGETIGQYAATQVEAGRMPPTTAAKQPTADERALLIAWVAAGVPAGSCGPLMPPAVP